MFIEPMITWVLSGFSAYIWLDTKIVLKKLAALYITSMADMLIFEFFPLDINSTKIPRKKLKIGFCDKKP